MDLRRRALDILQLPDVSAKAEAARELAAAARAAPDALEPVARLAPIAALPRRPERPRTVPLQLLPRHNAYTAAGRAALLHAVAHIELNAIDLAFDLCWRFPNMPEEFYRQWIGVAKEEAYHYQLLRDHLRPLGYEYGDFPAHKGLWEMAEKTKHDLLARIALVPRTLEARGLDASPPIKAKLVGAGDHRAGEILDIILRDKIGHVATGNRWYRVLCDQRGLDSIATYAELAARYHPPRLRGPFNLEARRAAGFDEVELAAMTKT